MGLVPGLPWPSSRCGKWSVNSLQICCGWGGPRALAGRNVTWTPLHREAALRDGAFMHIVSGPNRKLTQQFKGEAAGEKACWRWLSCGGFLEEERRLFGICPTNYHSWYFTVDCSSSNISSTWKAYLGVSQDRLLGCYRNATSDWIIHSYSFHMRRGLSP